MTPKLLKPKSYRNLFRYLLNPEKEPEVLGGVFLGDTIAELTQEFEQIGRLSTRAQKKVGHFILSFAPQDGEVPSNLKLEIADEFLNRMGYGNCQYLIVAHGRDDPSHPQSHDHDHIHIAVNLISFEGKKVKDSHEKLKSLKIAEELEAEYGLYTWERTPSQDKEPYQGEKYRLAREQKQYQQGLTPTPPQPSTWEQKRKELQTIINEASGDQPSLATFFDRLIERKVTPKAYVTEKGRKRISYAYQGIHFRGSKLKEASFPKLINKRGIDYDPERDQQTMERAARGELSQTSREQQKIEAIDFILNVSQSSKKYSTEVWQDTQNLINYYSQGKPKVTDFFINLAQEGVIPHIKKNEKGKNQIFYKNTRFSKEEEIIGDEFKNGHFIDLIKKRGLENDFSEDLEVAQCAFAGDFSDFFSSDRSESVDNQVEDNQVEETDTNTTVEESSTSQATTPNEDKQQEKTRQDLATALSKLAQANGGEYLSERGSRVNYQNQELSVTKEGEGLMFQARKEEQDWNILVDLYQDQAFKETVANWAQEEAMRIENEELKKRKKREQFQKEPKQSQMEL
ncbi:MAG: relaxase/mobilization nuclease domain-containing protein, partial [Halothece sp.]